MGCEKLNIRDSESHLSTLEFKKDENNEKTPQISFKVIKERERD